MKKKSPKKNYNEEDFFEKKPKKNHLKKDKSSKRKLTIYDDFDDEELDDYPSIYDDLDEEEDN